MAGEQLTVEFSFTGGKGYDWNLLPPAEPDVRWLYKKKPGPQRNTGRKRVVSDFAKKFPKHSARRAANKRKALLSNPEYRERNAQRCRELVERNRLNPVLYSRAGIPDGMTRAQARSAWAEARVKADKVFNHMVEQGMVQAINPEDFEPVVFKAPDGTPYTVLVPRSEEAKASLALKEAMVMALSPMGNQQTKHAAIRTVLEWTKAKPASKSEVAVTKAEDWLAAVTADALKDDAEGETGSA